MNQRMVNGMINGMINEMNQRAQVERSHSQMTLGRLIAELEELAKADPNRAIEGLNGPHSYRGYYCDLSFEPAVVQPCEESALVDVCTVREALNNASACLGQTFEGWKGGDFRMSEDTPVWSSAEGSASGQRIMGLNTTAGEVVRLITADED